MCYVHSLGCGHQCVECSKLHENWPIVIDSHENHHLMSDFKTKIHQIRFHLTALPRPPSRVRGFAAFLLKNPALGHSGLEPTVLTHFSFPPLACLFNIHVIILHTVKAAMDVRKKCLAKRSEHVKLKFRKFSTLQKR